MQPWESSPLLCSHMLSSSSCCHVLFGELWSSESLQSILNLQSILKELFSNQFLKKLGIMKALGFWVLLFMTGTTLICLSFTHQTFTTGMSFTKHEKDMSMTVSLSSRKLKYHSYSRGSEKSDAGSTSLQDYGDVDPVPSSKTSIDHEPVQHGSPLLPYIPPSPPAPGSP